MSTFSELQTSLKNRLKDTTDTRWTLTVKKEHLNIAWYNLAMKMYEMTEWRLITAATLSLVAGTRKYDLPEAFLYQRRVYFVDDWDLVYNHHREITIDDATGQPLKFWIEGSYEVEGETTRYAQMAVDPIPGGAYTLIYDYFPNPFTMDGDDDVPGIPPMFHDLIVTDAGILCWEDVGVEKAIKTWTDRSVRRTAEFVTMLGHRQRYTTPPLRNAFGHQSGGQFSDGD